MSDACWTQLSLMCDNFADGATPTCEELEDILKIMQRTDSRVTADSLVEMLGDKARLARHLQAAAAQGALGQDALRWHGTDAAAAAAADRATGALLGVVVGDVLGAAVEGWEAREVARKFPRGLRNFAVCRHMGVYELGPRYGVYTDDSNATLAVAVSLSERRLLDASDVAATCARFLVENRPTRGAPPTAIVVARELLQRDSQRPHSRAPPLCQRLVRQWWGNADRAGCDCVPRCVSGCIAPRMRRCSAQHARSSRSD